FQRESPQEFRDAAAKHLIKLIPQEERKFILILILENDIVQDVVQEAAAGRICTGFSNTESATKIHAEREEAKADYLALGHYSASQEQLKENIEGLYAPMINQTIKYSQIAIDKLDLSPEVVYSQRFDRRKFNEVRESMYASGAAKGLFKQKLPSEDAARHVGSFLGGDDVAPMARVQHSALQSAEDEYKRLNSKNIAADNGGNNNVGSENTDTDTN
ncbi:MAG: hypothetical protein AAF621_04865, partial [Pseudomonadota bacterium]